VSNSSHLVPVIADRAPALVAALGERASYRFFEFFTANIRNPHTRRAYARAAVEHARKSPADGEPCLDPHDTALRPLHRGSHVRRCRADTGLIVTLCCSC
jgi:hypothetical protein